MTSRERNVPREVAGEVSGDWFSEQPGISNHPLVLEAGRRDVVLAALLTGYLDFTVRLELTSIVSVTRDLVMRRLGADYGAVIVRDALRVQCDEAFHALLCEELAEHAARRHMQIERPKTGLQPTCRLRTSACCRCTGSDPPAIEPDIRVSAVLADVLSRGWLGTPLIRVVDLKAPAAPRTPPRSC